MKNEVSKGSENRVPENINAEKQNVSWQVVIMNVLNRAVRAIRPKWVFRLWKKRTNADGSSVETEVFIGRED